jgi:thiamine biosynthesis lipoprotein
MDADALSTIAFVLGYERGKALLESLEGVAAIFVLEDRSVRLAGDVNFILIDENYHLVSN